MENRGEKLQALLDLVQMDLDTVRQENQRDLIIKAAQITNQNIFIFSSKALAYWEITKKNRPAWNAWDALLEMKTDVLFVLNWMLDHKNGFCIYLQPSILEWSPNAKIVERTHTWPEPEKMKIKLVDTKAPPGVEPTNKEIRIESQVVLQFIEGVLWDRLKRCPCGKIFVQMTARNKIYHSMKCARRYAAKRSDERKRKEVK